MMMLNFDFVLRLLVAGILGAIIGLDREYRAKEAGYRTHFLVSLGSALIMIVSQYGFQEIIKESSVTLDPSRVAAQVVSGIGFIGAGTIIFQKQIVRGLTTAAGIWATAGIGLAVGAGMYTISIAATLLTLAVNAITGVLGWPVLDLNLAVALFYPFACFALSILGTLAGILAPRRRWLSVLLFVGLVLLSILLCFSLLLYSGGRLQLWGSLPWLIPLILGLLWLAGEGFIYREIQRLCVR